jgi:iron complex transport system substrate-binding protein
MILAFLKDKMNNRLVSIVLLVALCSACLSACQQSPDANKPTGGVTVTDANNQQVTIADSSRIVSIGTANTETINALGALSRVVGVDNSSSEYIAEVKSLPKVGGRTALNAEGVLSLKPTLVIASADVGPAETVNQLKGAGVAVLLLPANFTIDTLKSKVKTIALALGLEAKGGELVSAIDRDMDDVNKLLSRSQSKPKVMFVGRGPNAGNATMSGTGTTIDEMIRLAGGVNPMNDFQGSRPMTDEAVVNAAPDVILITERSFERSGGTDGVLQFPGVALTPAGKNRRIVPVSDMYFQGFGPSVGRALQELVLKFHPELGGGTNANSNAQPAATGASAQASPAPNANANAK